MKKQKIRFMIKSDKWIQYDGDYYYGEAITKELCNLFYLEFEDEDDMMLKDTIKYFKDNRSFVARVINKRIQPFSKKETADELAKERLLQAHPKATDDIISDTQLNIFAGYYVKDKIIEDLKSLHIQIQNYSDYICNKFLKEC
ncbi:TPA: hypothetical protein LA460_000312 [Clostridium botulinum]|nr:hypothetical protein [Clostridium botulinum]HBJ1652916.1 hypothetical protein [Clostridium botulinum]